MNTVTKLILVCSFAFGCATSGGARPGREIAARRGAVHVEGPSVRAIVVGPRSIHAYAAHSGGAIYVAPAVSGTDSDCLLAERGGAAGTAPLHPDRIVPFDVGAGQVACLETAREGSFELLWHAMPSSPRATASDLVVARARAVD